jgi:hypothetical protein
LEQDLALITGCQTGSPARLKIGANGKADKKEMKFNKFCFHDEPFWLFLFSLGPAVFGLLLLVLVTLFRRLFG